MQLEASMDPDKVQAYLNQVLTCRRGFPWAAGGMLVWGGRVTPRVPLIPQTVVAQPQHDEAQSVIHLDALLPHTPIAATAEVCQDTQQD